MRVITRQFTKEILLSTLFVLTALVALFAFFDLIARLDDISGDYGIAEAFLLTGLILPARIYEGMPLAVLLACVFTFSRWAASSEFTALRVAGMSPLRLSASLILPGVLLVSATYFFGEVVAPWASHYATEVKSRTNSTTMISARDYRSGVWVRDLTVDSQGRKVDRYINVSSLVAGREEQTGAWRMFEFSEDGTLLRIVKAKAGVYVPEEGWRLTDSVVMTYPKLPKNADARITDGVVVENSPQLVIESDLGPDILTVLTIKPEELSLRGLDKYLDHLKSTNQQTENYEIAFWKKVFYPLAIFVMIALSMPFAYMNARSGGMAIKIFLGVMLGIFFYAINNLFSYIGMLNAWPALAVSLAPTLVMLSIAAVALYFVEKR